MDEVALGLGVEAAGDLVAEQQARIGCQFDGEAEAPLLSAGEEADVPVGDVPDADGLEDLVNSGVALARAQAADAQACRGAEVFGGGEPRVRDAELRHIPEFRGRKILLLQVLAVPEDAAPGDLEQAGDGPQQRGFSAARGADDCAKVGLGE